MSDESRKQFEEWAKEQGLISESFGLRCVNEQFVNACWESWKASRSALVVELPVILGDGLVARTLMVAIKDCTERLTAAGIAVKGEGDETNPNDSR